MLRYRWAVIILLSAVLTGLLHALPQILIWKKLSDLGESYVLVQLTHHGDEAQGYIPRAREIYDGHFPPSDPHFNEKAPHLFGPFPITTAITAGFLFISGGDVNTARILMDFVLTAILFILFFIVGKTLLNSKLWALFSAFLGVLTPVFIHIPRGFKSAGLFGDIILKNFIPIVRTPLPSIFLSRLEDPLLTYLFYLPAIAAVLWFWDKPSKKTAVVSGVAVGLMFYVYFHYWVYLVVVLGLAVLYVLLSKHQREVRLKPILIFVLSAFFVSIPYWINFLALNANEAVQDFIARTGVVKEGRYVYLLKPFNLAFDYLFYLLMGIAVYFLLYKIPKTKQRAVLYWLMIAAMFIVWNLQLVVGYNVAPDHWFRTVSPWLVLILLHLLYSVFVRGTKHKIFLPALLILLMSLLVTKKIVNASLFINPPTDILERYSFNKNIVDSWKWINENLPHEPRIISPSFVTGFYLIGQTSARPYLASGGISPVSNKKLEERFMIVHKAFNVSNEGFEARLRSGFISACPYKVEDCDSHTRMNLGKPMQHLYYNFYKDGFRKDVFRYITPQRAEELVAQYKNLPDVAFSAVDADYVYYGPWERQIISLDLSKNKELELIYKNEEVEIYKISKQQRE